MVNINNNQTLECIQCQSEDLEVLESHTSANGTKVNGLWVKCKACGKESPVLDSEVKAAQLLSKKNQVSDLAEQASEGINNLESKDNFDSLKMKDLVPKLKEQIEDYRGNKTMESLSEALKTFRSTSGLTTEGADTYNVTIWDTNVEVRGKETMLDDIFSKLGQLEVEIVRES